MKTYTFEDLAKVDIFTCAEIINEMTEEEKRYTLSTAPELTGKTTFLEAMKRTPDNEIV